MYFCACELLILSVMTEKTRAIVLHSIKYGESQLIVEFLTESQGRVSFLVRVPKSSRGKVKRQYLQPLMLVHIEFDYRPTQKLQKLTNIGIAYPYVDLPFSPIKTSVSLFLAEFLVYATRHEQQNSSLFDFVFNSLVWLDAAQGSIANFHLLFLMRLTFFLGLEPNLMEYDENSYFDMQEGCFVHHVPVHSHYLSLEDSRHLVQMFRLSYKTMHLYTMSRQERNHSVEVMVEYYRLHIPNFPNLKSLPVLQSLFTQN